MLSFAVVSLLTTTLANPLPNPQPAKGDSRIATCKRSPNCETYKRKDGSTSIRFKAGHGPGSHNHNRLMARTNHLMKREDVDTHVQVGDTQIAWGCGTDPVVELGNLDTSCHDWSCVPTDAYEKTIQHLDVINEPDVMFSSPEDTKLSIHAEGEYSSTDQRDNLIALIQAAAGSKNPNDDTQTLIELHKDVHWSQTTKSKRDPESPIITNPHADSAGSCDVPVLSSFISASTFDREDPPNLVASIDATAELPDWEPSNGFCALKDNFDFAGAALGPFGQAGSVASAGFGALSMGCGD